jgi:hypothetical protein
LDEFGLVEERPGGLPRRARLIDEKTSERVLTSILFARADQQSGSTVGGL